MSLNICTVCRKGFSIKSSLVRHMNNRRKPCHPDTHHCNICEKGFSSYQSLWEHRRKCQLILSSAERKTPTVISDSAKYGVSMGILNFVINTVNERPTTMEIIPYMMPSKSDDMMMTTTERITLTTPSQTKKIINTGIINPIRLEYSEDKYVDYGNGDKGDEEIKKLISRLVTSSELIAAGYIKLKPAITDTMSVFLRTIYK